MSAGKRSRNVGKEQNCYNIMNRPIKGMTRRFLHRGCVICGSKKITQHILTQGENEGRKVPACDICIEKYLK